MSAPTEALGLVPNWDRRPGERSDIRPHGTEARARRHRRRSEKPCDACLRAENAAHEYRRAAAAARSQEPQPAERTIRTMTDRPVHPALDFTEAELAAERAAEEEAELADNWDCFDEAAYWARVEAGLEPEAEL